MDLSSIKSAFDLVAKKQRLYCSKTQELIDQMIQELELVLTQMQSVQDPTFRVDQKSFLTELNDKINGMGAPTLLEGSQKELSLAMSKYAKLMDKSFEQDMSRANRRMGFDVHIVNQIIACHFYRLGLFDLGDNFLNESREPEEVSTLRLRTPFVEMHTILEAMKFRNLGPAVKWAASQHDLLIQNGSNLELKLRTLEFVEMLQKGNRGDALNYARTYLAPFASLYMADIQKLMACLLWVGRLDSSPYVDLLAPINWETLAEEVTQQFCSLLGQSRESPLSVVIAAGIQGLPTLLKLAGLMSNRKEEWEEMKHLPVSVDVGKEFQFHTVFVCPVSKEQASDENPPMLMPCCHVLCKQSIVKLSKSSNRAFKCPYCPSEATVAQCRQLHL